MEKHIDAITIDNREYNREQRRIERVRNLKIKKAIFKVIGAFVLVGGISSLISHNTNPVNKAANEALSDAELNILDNGRQADSHMTDEELAQYVDKHNITAEELSEAIGVKLKFDGLYSEDNMEKIERLNSEAFEEARNNSKGM